MGKNSNRDAITAFYKEAYGFSPPNSPRNQTNTRTVVIETMYLRVLGELCMNRFNWEGTDGTAIDKRWLEMQLYSRGLAVVFKDDKTAWGADTLVGGTGKIFALAATPSGVLNIIGNPTSYTLYGPGFQGKKLYAPQCVPVWANYMRMPDWDITRLYANRLAEIDRTIEINVKSARRSKVLTYSEETRLTAQNINDMLDRGEATIPLSFNMGDMVQALDLGVEPKSIEELSIVRARIWNEAMGLLGINNANQDKKERLVSDEVDANNDQVVSMRRVNLNARQEAAKKINDRYGTNISVDYYSDDAGVVENPIPNPADVTGTETESDDDGA